jgi:hypothetical protein
LHRTCFDKSYLKGMQVIGTAHTFNREDTSASDFAYWRQARADRLSIQ